MTVGTIFSVITGIVIVILGVCRTAYYCVDEYEKSAGKAITSLLLSLILGGLCIGGAIFYLNTESGKRAVKDMQSEIHGGIERTVEVYDVNGELIKTYEGKFDVEVGNTDGNPYIVFDDENNKRHIVYYTTGTILIDEK